MADIVSVVASGRTYVIAEIAQCHQGRMRTAKDLIDAAAAAGVDAVKSQKRCLLPGVLFDEAELAAPYTGPHSFGATYGEHRSALELGIDQHADLAAHARMRGVDYCLSPWDTVSLADCVSIGASWIKVPSALALTQSYMDAVIECELPTIISTGGCSHGEVAGMEYRVSRGYEVPWLAMMQCTSTYPSSFSDIDLRVLDTWQRTDQESGDAWLEACGHPCEAIGLSGHHRGIAVDIAAVAMGARVIERHITLDRTMRGSDHAAALEPQGMRALVRDIRAVELAMGSDEKMCHEAERSVMKKLRTRAMR